MNQKRIELIPSLPNDGQKIPARLTYWRSGPTCFSIDYKGIITEICVGDLGYGDMNHLDGTIHAAIGCKQKTATCDLKVG